MPFVAAIVIISGRIPVRVLILLTLLRKRGHGCRGDDEDQMKDRVRQPAFWRYHIISPFLFYTDLGAGNPLFCAGEKRGPSQPPRLIIGPDRRFLVCLLDR
jgi:hypothetical protein